MNTQKKGMTGKDIITVGIFSAIYFVINFAFMLLSGLHPLLWILMPGLIAVFAGIPFLMMCAKVPKTGAVVLMGFITALIYFVTGQFTVVILIAFAVSCALAEFIRVRSHYRSFRGNALAYVFFSLGMIGLSLIHISTLIIAHITDKTSFPRQGPAKESRMASQLRCFTKPLLTNNRAWSVSYTHLDVYKRQG